MRRRATTLLELLIVLTVLSVIAAVVGVSAGAVITSVAVDSTLIAAAELRSDAIRKGRRLTTTIHVRGNVMYLTALPDGRVISADSLRLEQLTGRRANATR